MTCSAHASCSPLGPLGRYWPKAGVPLATTGTRRDPLQPMPGPSYHARMAS